MGLRSFPFSGLLCYELIREANRVMEVILIIHQCFLILVLNPLWIILVFFALTHNFTLIRRADELSQMVWEPGAHKNVQCKEKCLIIMLL